MFFHKLLNVLLFFWAFVIIVITLNFLFKGVSSVTDTSWVGAITTSLSASDQKVESGSASGNTIEALKVLPLSKNYGLVLNNFEMCPLFLPDSFERDTRCQKNNTYTTSGHCFNGSCDITVEFGSSYPESVDVCVKKGDDCIRQTFDVPQNPEVVGYTATIDLTPERKEKLGIYSWEDKVELKGARGYDSKGDIYTFYYDEQPIGDELLVNDQVQLKVKFKSI